MCVAPHKQFRRKVRGVVGTSHDIGKRRHGAILETQMGRWHCHDFVITNISAPEPGALGLYSKTEVALVAIPGCVPGFSVCREGSERPLRPGDSTRSHGSAAPALRLCCLWHNILRSRGRRSHIRRNRGRRSSCGRARQRFLRRSCCRGAYALRYLQISSTLPRCGTAGDARWRRPSNR